MRKAKWIADDTMGLRRFLGMKEIGKVSFRLHREERDLSGAMFRFAVQTEKGEKRFFAKLTHSSRNDSNPTKEEFEMTVRAAKAGIAPHAEAEQSALLIEEITNGISLDRMMDDPQWRRFFFDNERLFVRRIGEVYGILNKRLRILHDDVRLDHLFITRDKTVKMIDFSTQNEEGVVSRYVSEGSHDNDLSAAHSALLHLIRKFSQGELFEEASRQGAPVFERHRLYERWLREGFQAADLQIERLDRQEKLLDELRRRFAETKSPLKVLVNMDFHDHIGSFWERHWSGVPGGNWAWRALKEGLVEYYAVITPRSSGVARTPVRIWKSSPGRLFQKVKMLEYEDQKAAEDAICGAEALLTVDTCAYSVRMQGKEGFHTSLNESHNHRHLLVSFLRDRQLLLHSPVYFAESADLTAGLANAKYREGIVLQVETMLKGMTKRVERSGSSGSGRIREALETDATLHVADPAADTVALMKVSSSL